MRKGILLEGSILLIVGVLFITLGTLTGTSENTMTSEDIFNSSYSYDFLGNHEYRTTADLLPATYELRYNFSSTGTVTEFYVKALDPDGFEIKSVYGPPTTYQNQTAKLTLTTQRTGQHTFILGGTWTSVQINLFKLTQTTKTVYPYEITLYVGSILLISGATLSILGVQMKEKRQPQWFDEP